ncbi:hypothetical protein V1514DRAFT_328439 [Lipomyces japonicus]|uniref:uncharacterized protein n=1 Tax=Lipomyces japonicus TaxID=56871 RepID=UPI0034CF3763
MSEPTEIQQNRNGQNHEIVDTSSKTSSENITFQPSQTEAISDKLPIDDVLKKELAVYKIEQGNAITEPLKQNPEETVFSTDSSVATAEVTDSSTKDQSASTVQIISDEPTIISARSDLSDSDESSNGEEDFPVVKKRLPNDIAGVLQDRLEKLQSSSFLHPPPLSAYNNLIEEYQKRGKLDFARKLFERSLEAYPSVATQWLLFIEMETSAGEFPRADELFGRAVKNVTSLIIWEEYLSYVRRRNNIITEGETARRTILQAFEVVTENIGIDAKSGRIWSEYLQFIRNSPVGSSSWEIQQKMDLQRKVYTRVLAIPVGNLEQIWQDYTIWENGLNKTTARKFLADRSAAYMSARSCLKEFTQLSNGLQKDATPVPPKWDENDLTLVQKWQKWIDWEKKDPLGFNNEDSKIEDGEDKLFRRIIYAYKQSLQVLRFFPSVWFEASEYASATGYPDLQLELLKEGVVANPGSSLLHFKLAEVYELSKKRDDARRIYQSLSNTLIKEIKSTEQKSEERKAALYSKVHSQNISVSADEESGAKNSHVQSHAKNAEVEQKINKIEQRIKTRIASLSKEFTISSIFFMRAQKRMEGLKNARQVFSDARKSQYSTYSIYVDAAMMEYHHNKGPEIASKIFELGLKRFPDSVDFIGEYLNFLILTNDDTNARALFERTASKLPPEVAKPLYQKFYEYESAYGDELSAVVKLESRMAELYPNASPVVRFSERYFFNGKSAFNQNQVGPIVYRDILKDENQFAEITSDEEEEEEDEIEGEEGEDNNAEWKASGRAYSKEIKLSKRAQKRAIEVEKTEARKRKKQERAQISNVGPSRDKNALPDGIVTLLTHLMPAAAYKSVQFDIDSLINLIDETSIPDMPPSNANLTRFKKT